VLKDSELSEEVGARVKVLLNCFLNDPCVGVVRDAKQFGLQVSSCNCTSVLGLDQNDLPKDACGLDHLDFCEHPNLITNVFWFFFGLN
jgi:hypothetical protein